MKENIVITVSRKYGCGGRELANILAEKLNLKLYDRQIVHIAAAKLGIDDLNEQDLLELENTVHPLTMAFMPFRSFGIRMGESSRGMFLSEATAVRKLANSGSCVILGRCADYILDDMPNVFSIFVTADDEYREKRGKEVYGGKTLKELDIEDGKRARYYNYYTGQQWGKPSNYDLVVNAGTASLDEIADAIIKYINALQK
ncbi:AAA family ATPase [Megamonas hypermegale]|uniref:cytidylate kinase-like family protein n=1 Tax=Megamonas hypermegale TaxID=158847 RepID=UPI00195BB741|nr:cytidylate kinase-like family protein [Megamonas hypermegale]MBM6760593.1 cytidylate kinase-like family protein [Megamonas hypermegale]MBM6833296.1 cytidylate kinase-like family protein [Megamonas hypermegale]